MNIHNAVSFELTFYHSFPFSLKQKSKASTILNFKKYVFDPKTIFLTLETMECQKHSLGDQNIV